VSLPVASNGPAGPATAPRATAGWLLVGLLSATATASYLCRVNLSVVGVLVMREFGLSQVQMGPVFSAFLVTYALMQVPAGLLADRWGARRVLTGAAVCWALATLVQAAAGTGFAPAALVPPFALLIAGRLLLGVGEAPTFTAAAQGISRWMPPGAHARANGLVIAAVGLGSAIAPPLLTWAMLRVGWRGALLVSALPAAAAAIAWRFVRTPTSRPEGLLHDSPDAQPAMPAREAATPVGQAATPVGQAFRPAQARDARSFALLTASYTLQGYVGYIFVFWFYLYLVQERHFDLLRGAVLGSLPWVLTIVSVPLGGLVADRLSARGSGGAWRWRIVPLAGLVGAGAFIAVGAHTANPWLAAVSLAGATGLVMSVEGPFWATMTRLSGGRAGRGGGIMNMGCNLGGLVSPALTPLLAAHIGWESALHVAAILSVAGGLLWLGIAPPPPAAIDDSPVAS
jgi:MFS transporter, ACS family, glucarate transporter